ncbi:NUT family member 2G-like [Tupaia chinensis]|uniref:NUT family member 2G-like n=1 Tax=Tupaia chinensis TaxID=246437 RepID=UPI000FFCAF40|nr:NUT family member 2G-like [Tupaia chinensis]
MSLQEGLSRAMQEWQRTSSFDRRKYYDMAANVSRKTCPKAMPRHLLPSSAPQRSDPKRPKDILPEAMQEYVDIMKGLLGHGGQWAEDAVQPGQEDGAFPDLGLLSYMEELCSQEDFVTKVEAILHPQFLAELLSPKPGMDLLVLMEELEQEEGLTPDQVLQEGRDTRQKKESGTAEWTGGWSPGRPGRARHLVDQGKGDTWEIRKGTLGMTGGRNIVYIRREGYQVTSEKGQGALGSVGTSPVRGTRWPADGSSEDEEQLPSLAFFMASLHSLLPWVPPLSPASTSGRLRPGGRRHRGATKARSAQRRGLSSATHLPSKSKKRDVIGGPIPSSKKLKLSPEFGVSGEQVLALGLTGPSQL